MRVRLAVIVTAAMIGSLVSSPSAAQATEASPIGADASTAAATGRYVPKATTRVLDTRSKIGVPTTSPLRGGQTISLDLSKYLPTSATSVALSLAVVGPTRSGYVITYPSGTTRPRVTSLNFGAGAITRNLAAVALSAGRKISLYMGTSGTTHLVADLTGYFRGGTADQGGFGSAASRILSTRDGVGVSRSGPLAAGKSIDFTAVRGSARIPADASSLVVNITAGAPTSSGSATAYPTGGVRPTGASVYFTKGLTTSALAVVPIGAHGQVTLSNNSSGSAQFYADVEGYIAGSDPTTTGALAGLASRRLLDTRDSSPVAAGKVTTVNTFGRGGVPRARVAQVVLSLTATNAKASGHLSAYSGARASIGTVNYVAGHSISGIAIVTPDSTGRVTIYSSATTNVLVDVTGYVLASDLDVPNTTTSRYVSSLDAISGTGSASEGCIDGSTNSSFVLLDVGAQTVTPDPVAGTSAADPGVSLALNNPAVRATYPDLVNALDVYVEQFAACKTASSPTRIALATNNDGVFDPKADNYYSPNARGSDWANQVVDLVDTPAGVAVIGAGDIESGFASSEAQAEQWTTAFLAKTSADLVFVGALENCPDAYASSAECGPVKDSNNVDKTWTRAQYVRLAYGLSPGRISVLPQIYYSVANQAARWANLYVTSDNKLTFEGSLTQFGVCGDVSCGFRGAQGWSALYHALSTVVTTPSLPVATDLQSQ